MQVFLFFVFVFHWCILRLENKPGLPQCVIADWCHYSVDLHKNNSLSVWRHARHAVCPSGSQRRWKTFMRVTSTDIVRKGRKKREGENKWCGENKAWKENKSTELSSMAKRSNSNTSSDPALQTSVIIKTLYKFQQQLILFWKRCYHRATPSWSCFVLN